MKNIFSIIQSSFFRKTFFWLFLFLFSFNLYTFAQNNEYVWSELDDINVFGKTFQWIPLVVATNTFNWAPLSDLDLKNFINSLGLHDYMQLKDPNTGATITVNKKMIYLDMWKSLWQWYDFVLDVPNFTPTFKDLPKGSNLDLMWKRSLFAKSDYVPFLLEGSTDYKGNNEYWLMYEAETQTPKNHFLPRKVLVDVYNGADQIASQVIDVFESWKMSVTIPEAVNAENVSLRKNRFYVIWETHEKAFWYFNWPVITEILCPDKLSSSQNCQLRIIPQDNWDVKVKIKNKYTNEVYQTFEFPITRNTGVDYIEKEFFINLELWYPDGDYVITAESYKNGLMGQLHEKDIIIDRLPPTFDDLFPIVLIPIEQNGEYVATVKVSERLSESLGEAMKEQGSAYITSYRKDPTNPLIYHLTINSANIQSLKNIKVLLKDISWNTQTSNLYIKRYVSRNHLWIKNVNTIPNWLTMDVETFRDNSIEFDNPLLGSHGEINGIEKHIDLNNPNAIAVDTQKTLLMWYNNILNKVFPTKNKVREYPKNIKSISFNGLNKYYIITQDNTVYANWLRAYSDKQIDLRFYNIYKNEYIMTYSDIGLFVDGKRLLKEGSDPANEEYFPNNYLWFDLLHWDFNSNKVVYAATYGGVDNKLRVYRLDLENKTYKLINTIDSSDTNNYSSMDLTLYNNKIITLGRISWTNKTNMAIFPFPLVEIQSSATNSILYPAWPKVEFDALIYDKLEINPIVKGEMLPRGSDCSAWDVILIDGKAKMFDGNPYCNYEELQLRITENIGDPDKNDYLYYDDKADTYIEHTQGMVKVHKYWLNSDVWPTQLQTENKPTKYYIWLVRVSDIVWKAEDIGKAYKNSSESWELIKFTSDQLKYLPEIISYDPSEKKYLYKLNDKLLTLNNLDGEFLWVVSYDTKYWPSNIKFFNLITKTDILIDPTTWEFQKAERVLWKRLYKIDTIRPIIYDIQSSNLVPKVGTNIDILFKVPEEVTILDMELWRDKVPLTTIEKEEKGSIQQYIVKNVPVLNSSYSVLNNKKVLRVFIKAKDKANNITEREVFLEWELGKISTSSLSVGEITTETNINVSDVLNSTDPTITSSDKINVLTGKKVLSAQEINVKFPRKPDNSIDFDKLFPGYNIVNVGEAINDWTIHKYLHTYDKKGSNKNCSIYKDWSDYVVEWYCWFIRNKVYYFDANLKIMSPLFYKGYSTLFSLWNVLINADVLKEVEALKKEHLLWIINAGDITISWHVKTVQSLMKTEWTIVIKK